MPIPNIFHYINIGPREFNLMHFLSIYSAYKLNNPDKIYIYVDRKQENNIYWDILKHIVTYVYITPPDEYMGIPLTTYQYKADIIRMTKLIEVGGIYMDLDVLSLKPLTEFLSKDIVFGSELSDDPKSTNLEEFKSITNAVILTEPDNSFMKLWFSEMGKYLTDKPWAYHAVCLPKELLLTHKYPATLVSSSVFMPFCFRKPFIWESDKIDQISTLQDSYTIHLWETIWADYVRQLSVRYFIENNNCMTILFKKYIYVLKKNKELIKKIIVNSSIIEDTNKMNFYTDMLYWINKLD